MTNRPEPPWWAEARRLRFTEGWKIIAIAAHFGRHQTTVEYALFEHIRNRKAMEYKRWLPKRRSRRKKISFVKRKTLDTSQQGG